MSDFGFEEARSMNGNTPDSPHGRYRMSALVICVGCIVFASIVFFYQWSSYAPSELNRVSGVLSEEKVGRNVMTKITDGENVYWFTCASRLGGFSKCLSTEGFPGLDGKNATVYWYYQRVFPAMENRKLVVLVVDGKEIISRVDSEYRLARSKEIDLWLYAVFGVIIFCILAFFIRKARRD